MQRNVFALATVCALSGLLALAACGSDISKGCVDFANAACSRFIECSAYRAKFYGMDLGSCETILQTDCSLSSSTSGTSRNSDQSARCAAAMRKATCDEVLGGVPIPDCFPAGSLADGANCGDNYQCQSIFCKRAAGSTCGTCTRRGHIGEACPDGVCELGAQCANAICIPFRKMGEACDSEATCLPSLACVVGVCAAPMIGATCNQPWECSGTQAQYCDGNTLTCQSFPLRVAADGEACGESNTEIVSCRSLSYCKTTNGAAFGVCTPTPDAGQPCGGEQSNICRYGLVCVDKTCQKLDRNSCK